VADGNGNGSATATAEPAAAETPSGEAARVEEVVARSLAQTRTWLNRRRLQAEVLAPAARLSTREWLVCSAFSLFAVVTIGVVVFSALGLLNATEAISAMLPVSTLTAVIIGVYLGADRTA
jgi:hypothetical protein